MADNKNPERREGLNQKNQDQSQAVAGAGNLVCVEPEVAELADHYIKLVCFLDELNQKLDTTENPLEICLDALVAVKRFVDVHPTVAQKGITRPLWMLAASIQDLTLGSTPKLLKPNPNIKGRPKSVSGKVTLQATGAACAEILIWCGLSVESACKYVLKALEKEKQVNAPRIESSHMADHKALAR
jgi:hypothetical protein